MKLNKVYNQWRSVAYCTIKLNIHKKRGSESLLNSNVLNEMKKKSFAFFREMIIDDVRFSGPLMALGSRAHIESERPEKYLVAESQK